MKRLTGIIIAAILFSFIFSTNSMAKHYTGDESGIVLDGSFNDWEGKPSIKDSRHDIKIPWFDFLNVKYFADDKYLYLYVERLSAEKSEPWHFNVIIVNANEGRKYVHYPFGKGKPVYAPQLSITSYYDNKRSHEGTIVEVAFEGEELESTYSADKSNKKIEFRIPLSKVGLGEQNRQVEFMLKSDKDDYEGEIDWVPDGGTILVTTGPTLWSWAPVLFIVPVCRIVYRKYKKS